MKDLISKDLMSEIFGDVFRPLDKKYMAMRTDIKEDEKNIVFDIEMPGFDKKDIELKMHEGYMVVSARQEQKEEEKDKEGKTYVARERYQSASRSYFVGDKIVEEEIRAKYENGVLTVTIPKIEPKKEIGHKIQID